MTDSPIRVLVVDDEPLTAEAHAAYIDRLEGFAHVATAHTGQEAVRLIREAATGAAPIDLVLMDMNLPDMHGLDVSRRIRALGLTTDIIAITAARDLVIVRGAIAVGVVHYLIKPFSYATFADKLRQYSEFRRRLGVTSAVASQSDVDHAFASLRSPGELSRPKGLAEDTLTAVSALLRSSPVPLSATEAGVSLGTSRVTVRRYLEYLAEDGQVLRMPRYGTPGRPENEYSWRGRMPH
jgi:response regulator of citrate/malate metabolism